MKTNIKTYILLLAAGLFLAACGNSGHNEEGHEHENGEESEHHEHGEGHEEEVHFSEQQFQSLAMKVGYITLLQHIFLCRGKRATGSTSPKRSCGYSYYWSEHHQHQGNRR